MLRALLLVLLLVNAGLLAARQGWFGGRLAVDGASEREPLRLQRQVHPELVRVLPDPTAAAPAAGTAVTAAASGASVAAAAASSAAASTALATSSPSAASTPGAPAASSPAAGAAGGNAASAAAPALAPTHATACLEAGPFNRAEAPAAERALREAGLAPTRWQALAVVDNGSWLVYLGPYRDPAAMQARRDELRARGIAAEALPDTSTLYPGLDLGRHDDRASADAAQARHRQAGLRSARVVNLRPAQRQLQLRVSDADPALRAKLAALKLPSGPGFVACSTAPAGAAAAPRPQDGQ